MAEQALVVQHAPPKPGARATKDPRSNGVPPGTPGWKATVATTLRSLDLSRRVLGVNHQETFRWMSKLADAVKPADAGLALKLHRFTATHAADALGVKHPRTQFCRHYLAICLHETGETEAAMDMLREVLDRRERALGPEHPDTLATAKALARYLDANEGSQSVVHLFRGTLERNQQKYGADHPRTLTSVHNFAMSIATGGDADHALPLLRRALEGRERLLGPEHPDTLVSLNELAVCMASTGDRPVLRRCFNLRWRSAIVILARTIPTRWSPWAISSPVCALPATWPMRYRCSCAG